MKKRAVIEKSDTGGYGIYIPDVPGYIGLGKTEDEAKNDLWNAIKESVADCKELGIKDDLNGGSIEFEYQYDFSGSFKKFDIFNVSALAKAVGINSGLMRQYKAGKTYISYKRKQQIENGIHQLVGSMSDVRF